MERCLQDFQTLFESVWGHAVPIEHGFDDGNLIATHILRDGVALATLCTHDKTFCAKSDFKTVTFIFGNQEDLLRLLLEKVADSIAI